VNGEAAFNDGKLEFQGTIARLAPPGLLCDPATRRL